MPDHDFRSPRLYVDAPLAEGRAVALEAEQSNYLGNVLRLKAGDPILVFNGSDGEWRAAIAGRKRPDSLTIESQTRPQDRLGDLAYVFAPLKHARLDYMVQKAVEMGASSLKPVLTRFTQVSRVNTERMRANAIEAAEQCGILTIAAVADPVPLERFLASRERANGRMRAERHSSGARYLEMVITFAHRGARNGRCKFHGWRGFERARTGCRR